MVSNALFSFSLTPVQGFIEASRSVRDLKSGSALLSHLTEVALQAAKDAGGTLIFPAAPGDDTPKDDTPQDGTPPAIPNIFLARFGNMDAAKAAEEACRSEVIKRWCAIAETVHDELHTKLNECDQTKDLAKDWDKGWCYQIKHFWDIQTIALASADVPEVLKALTAPADSTNVTLGDEFRAIQALLASKKMCRYFPGDNGIGRHKCALMGEWEQMGPAGSADNATTSASKFWTAVAANVQVGGLWLTSRDRLCAPALVKRFCKISEHMPQAITEGIPDTATVACQIWWNEAQLLASKQTEEFTQAVKALRDTTDTELRYLLDDTLNPAAIARDLGMSEDGIKDQVEKLRKARTALFESTRDTLQAPPRYYAILVQDGDEMGKWLSGAKQKVDEAFYKGMSEALQGYASSVQGTVNTHHGCPVYAGGDDALALLPLSEALACAQRLREEFPQFGTDRDDKSPTLSAGLAIVHYKYDLRAALRAARAAEKRAKEEGRNALGINLVKRSGAPAELTLSWDMVPELERLRQLFDAGLSDGWLPRVAAYQPHLQGWCYASKPVFYLIGQEIRSLHLTEDEKKAVAQIFTVDEKEAEESARAHIKYLWEKIHKTTLGIDGKGKECSEFIAKALDRFIDFGLIASFLHRGRD